MFCSNCGKEIEENVKFCSNCGAEIGTVTVKKNNNNEKKEKEKSNKKIKVVLGIIIVLIIGIIWFINRPHIYEIGETVKAGGLEIKLIDVQYGEKINKDRLSENYLLPENNFLTREKDYSYAPEGMCYVVITYELSNIGKYDANIDCGATTGEESYFWLVYSDDKFITDSDKNFKNSYAKNNENGEWDKFYGELKTTSDTVKIREYIIVPENIINNNETLVLEKDVYGVACPGRKYLSRNSEKVQYRLK